MVKMVHGLLRQLYIYEGFAPLEHNMQLELNLILKHRHIYVFQFTWA